MKPLFISFELIFIFIQFCNGQNDSSTVYISKDQRVTSKDSAYLYEIVTKKNNVWHGKTYFLKTKTLQSEGDYTGANCTKPIGTFNNYNEDGTIFNTAVYNDSSKYYRN